MIKICSETFSSNKDSLLNSSSNNNNLDFNNLNSLNNNLVNNFLLKVVRDFLPSNNSSLHLSRAVLEISLIRDRTCHQHLCHKCQTFPKLPQYQGLAICHLKQMEDLIPVLPGSQQLLDSYFSQHKVQVPSILMNF